MEENIKKTDEILDNLIELAHSESEKAKSRNYFSKDLAEACGVIISLAYGRYGKNDKQINKYGS